MNFNSIVPISGLSFYHRGKLRNITDKEIFYTVQGWRFKCRNV